MKKVLFLAMIAATLTTSTGCVHKKRVQRLEEELLRCKAEYQQLRSDAAEPAPGDAQLAVAVAPD